MPWSGNDSFPVVGNFVYKNKWILTFEIKSVMRLNLIYSLLMIFVISIQRYQILLCKYSKWPSFLILNIKYLTDGRVMNSIWYINV